jgi:hypothetical protein
VIGVLGFLLLQKLAAATRCRTCIVLTLIIILVGHLSVAVQTV